MLKTLKNVSSLAFESLKLTQESSDLSHKKSQALILNLLAQERGLALKIAQLLGSSDEAIEELKQLPVGQGLEAIALKDLTPVIESSLGKPIKAVFEELEEAKWVASIGQVHPCVVKADSRECVLKVQYPDIRQKLKQQLRLLGLVGHLGGRTKLKKWGFKVGEYLENFERMLDEEIDYQHEAKNIKRFGQLNSGRDVLFPEVIEELSTSNLLTLTFMYGEPVDTFFERASETSKQTYTEKFYTLILQHLLVDGFLQGDAHKGNFYVHRNTPVFLDFGNFIELDLDERKALAELLNNVMRSEHQTTFACLSQLGFDPKKLELVRGKIPALVDCLFLPIKQDHDFEVSDWQFKEEVDKLLGEDKWWIRSSGSAKFFQVIRSLYGVCSLIRSSKVKMNWRALTWKVLSSFERESSVLPAVERELEEIEVLSKHLKIEVFEDGRKKIDLSFPSRAALHIEELIDDETLKKLNEREVDLVAIKEKALSSQLKPQTLFELELENKQFRVFLVD